MHRPQEMPLRERASRERRGSVANCGNGRDSNGSSVSCLSRDERGLPEVFEVRLASQAIGHDDIANGVSSQDIVGRISIGRAFKVGQASITIRARIRRQRPYKFS